MTGLVELNICDKCGFEWHVRHGEECASCECDVLRAKIERLRVYKTEAEKMVIEINRYDDLCAHLIAALETIRADRQRTLA